MILNTPLSGQGIPFNIDSSQYSYKLKVMFNYIEAGPDGSHGKYFPPNSDAHAGLR